jgi:2-C-methyl-D-erythritol 4-phosphate cytidylyltransferase
LPQDKAKDLIQKNLNNLLYKNKALFEHSLDKAIKSKLFKKIILVVNDKKQIKKNILKMFNY